MSEKHDEARAELRELLNDMRMSSNDVSYGYFHGGDPNNFTPDPECSTDEERARHKEACAAWPDVKNPAPHCAFMNGGKEPPGFGLGTNTFNDPVIEDWVDRLERCINRLESE